jgi:hypothetical protein
MMEGRSRYIIVAIVWIATLSALLAWFLSVREEHLAFAAGPKNSESFQLATAIAEVFNEAHTGITLDVFETSGSAENIDLLESGQIDFATVQADTQLGERINAVASLYFDAFQLIVNASSKIQGFKDLEGHRVAIAPAGSGQNRSFWFVAGHYGLAADQLTALPMSEEAANFAMIMGQGTRYSGYALPVTRRFANWSAITPCAWCRSCSPKPCRSNRPRLCRGRSRWVPISAHHHCQSGTCPQLCSNVSWWRALT